MNEIRRWMRLIETQFLDHLQDAVAASEAGFHYEEGGCWGMALALYDAFKAMGKQPHLMLQADDFAHALVLVDGQLYDYSGAINYHPPVMPTTRAGLMRAALKSGQSAYDVRADAIAAAELIRTAQTWDRDET